jgi:hypothetical protein
MPRRATRIAGLLLALAVVAAWAWGRTRARSARTAWAGPVAVAVLVLDGGADQPPDAPSVRRLHASLDALAAQRSGERRRHAPAAQGPAFTVELFGPGHRGRGGVAQPLRATAQPARPGPAASAR